MLVVASVGGITYGTLSAASSKRKEEEEDDGMTVLNVSKRFVRKWLNSQPQMVSCLNTLSHMCDADETGQATGIVRRLVFHTTQLVYQFGNFANCETSMAVFRTHKNMQRIVTKVERDCTSLQVKLMRCVDLDMLKTIMQRFESHISNFMAGADVVADNMRNNLGHHTPGAADKKRKVVDDCVNEQTISARAKNELPIAFPALLSFTRWACEREPSATITKEKRRVHKLTTHLLQLKHSIDFKRDSARQDLLLDKIKHDLHELRQSFEIGGGQDNSRAFEEPFFVINNVMAEMRVGLSNGR